MKALMVVMIIITDREQDVDNGKIEDGNNSNNGSIDHESINSNKIRIVVLIIVVVIDKQH